MASRPSASQSSSPDTAGTASVRRPIARFRYWDHFKEGRTDSYPMSAFSRQRSACSTEASHCSRSSQILHRLRLNKLAQLRVTEAPEGAFEHCQRHHGLGHGAMASGTAIRPKSGAHEISGTASLGGMSD